MFAPERQRIGFERQELSAGSFDLIFVDRSGPDSGKENFPYPRAMVIAHRMAPAIPVIEGTNDADAACIGCPQGEQSSFDAVDCPLMRTETPTELKVISLADQVKIESSKHGRESVRVLRLILPIPDGDPKAVRESARFL